MILVLTPVVSNAKRSIDCRFIIAIAGEPYSQHGFA